MKTTFSGNFIRNRRENISQKRVLVPEKIRKKLQKFQKNTLVREPLVTEDIIIIKNFSIK